MKKSIFSKYIVSFISLLAIGFIAVAFVIISVITNYSISSKESLMNQTAHIVGANINTIMRSDDLNFSDSVLSNKEILRDVVDPLAAYSESYIVILDNNGNILLTSQNISDNIKIPQKINITGILQNSSQHKHSNLDGFFDEYRFNYIYSVPDLSHEKAPYVGNIIISTSANNFQMIFKQILSIILFASLWIFAAAVIAIYFITRRITTPIKRLSIAAKSYSNGDFSSRVPVVGNDEIADLATAFNQMAESLSNLNTTKNSFLSSVSHDLRTPMTSIQGFIDGILDGTIPPEKHNYYLGIVSGEVKRLSRLVNSLLDISRMESGSFKLQKVQFDICETARLILISFEETIDEKKINIEFETDDDPSCVFADKDAIYQILYNLIDNALKFTYENGLIRISIKNSGSKYKISVYNTGLGIKQDELPFVFERFFKSDSSRGLDKTGTGLGLYIAKSKLEAHGEKISVSSSYQKDCEFTFTLSKI